MTVRPAPLIAAACALPVLLAGCLSPAERARQAALDDVAHQIAADGTRYGDGAVRVGEAQRCIIPSNITRTQVVSDRVIDFSLGGRLYRNVLPEACPRLGFERRIAYDVRGGQLCAPDIFRVLDASPGIPGPACSFGEFQRIERPAGRRDLR